MDLLLRYRSSPVNTPDRPGGSTGYSTTSHMAIWRALLIANANPLARCPVLWAEPGQNVTFVNPVKWIGEWQPVEPYMALQEMARRYLRAFGPATVEEFAQWQGLRLIPARKLFRSLENEAFIPQAGLACSGRIRAGSKGVRRDL